MARVAGECNPLLADFLRRLGDVERMVGNSLKIGDRMQKLRHVRALAARQLASGELDQIRAQNILVAVDDALHTLDLGKIIVRIVTQQRQRAREVQLGICRHRVDGNAALLNSKRRVLQEALLEMHRGRLVCRLLVALVLDQSVDNRLNDIGERQQNYDLHEPEERVDEGDRDARHRHIQKGKPEHGVCQIKCRRPEHDTCHLDDEVDHCRALAVDIRADRGQKHRHRRADGNAHDDGKGNGKINHARRRQRLQNTDSR